MNIKVKELNGVISKEKLSKPITLKMVVRFM